MSNKVRYIIEGQLWRPLGNNEYVILQKGFKDEYFLVSITKPYRKWDGLDEETGLGRSELLEYLHSNAFEYLGMSSYFELSSIRSELKL